VKLLSIGLVVSFVFSASTVVAQDQRTISVDKLLADWNKPSSPGCAVAIIQNGQSVLRRGYGSPNLDYQSQISPDTVFYIASMSKQFTAAAVGILIREGKVALDDDVRNYIPELPKYDRTIQVRDLVYHTSGIRDYITLAEDLSDFRTVNLHTEKEYLDLLARQKKLNFSPGTQFSYSNSNYFLLGIIVKRVSGMSLRRFADKELFGPLGMKHTHYTDSLGETVPNRAIGYASTDNGFVRVDSLFDQVGDGGVLSTLNDLTLWDQEYYANKLGGSELGKLLLTTGELRDGIRLDYAFGLYVDPSPRGLKIYHGGSYLGFNVRLTRFPDAHTSVICLCNLGDVPTGRLTENIANIYLGDVPSSVAQQVAVSPETLHHFQGAYRDPSTSGIWVFQMKNAQLVASLLGLDGERPLLAESDHSFTTADGSFKAVFRPSADRVEIAQNNAPARMFSRVTLAQPKDLSEYVGSYNCEELDTRYQFVVRDGKLAVLAPEAAETPLSPSISDGFFGFGNYFLFERDKDERIVGVQVGENKGRVRNLECRRLG
jgi:CubicO group peptidase (beta-lactamase class C family)